MDDDEVEEDGEDVRAGFAVGDGFSGGGVRRPGGREDAGFDGGGDFHGVRYCIGAEELSVELREGVPDVVCFVGELDGEEGFEEGEELGRDFGLEGGHVAKSEEEADGLVMVSIRC